jgi:hypothetical protein
LTNVAESAKAISPQWRIRSHNGRVISIATSGPLRLPIRQP